MVAKNEITGDNIQTKSATQLYLENYDRIFMKGNNTSNDKNEYQDILSTEDCFLDPIDREE